MAAVAAAVLASQLGVYGTIAGAGVMSVVATCGGSVFQHFFRRTGEQLREVTVQVTHPEGRQVTVHTKETTPAGRRAAAQRTEPEPTGPESTDDATTVLPTVGPGTVPHVVPDAESTQVLRPLDTDRTQLLNLGDERTRMLRVPPAGAPGAPGAFGAGADADRTHVIPRADDRTQMLPRAGADRPAAVPDDAFGEGVTHGTRLRGWKRPALAAAAVFAVSMAGITAFELISGSDLSGGQGTTLSSVVRGGDRDSGPADHAPSGDTGKDGGADEQSPTPGDGTGSAPATDGGDTGGTSPDPGRSTGGENPTTGPTPTPTPSGSAEPTPEPTRPTPSDSGDTGTGEPSTGTGVTSGQGEQAPPGADAE
ncbi:hypothetical protein [Streptomyces sp. PTY087I2]|uniref:hypothetical protein n=1 Tax=Streptomyces sp. PTY087I2 TaxID=1819298 RepID=UPI00080B6696|nr:hypothetical protein [Streptomyces sp. PTY087I2]